MGEIAKLYAEGVPDDDLRLWLWGDRYDLTRYRQHFTNVNGAVLGDRMHFTAASSQYLRYPVADWRSGDSQGTILAWVKLDSVGVFRAVFTSSDETADTNFLYFGLASTNVLRLYYANGGSVNDVRGSTALIANRWYRIGVVSSGDAYALYLNGVLETLVVIVGTNTGEWLADTLTRDNVTIGAMQRSGVVNHFDGNIRDVPYYSRAFSADEIALDYATKKRAY